MTMTTDNHEPKDKRLDGANRSVTQLIQFNSIYLFAKSRLPVRQTVIELAAHDHKHNSKPEYKNKKADEMTKK